MTIITDNSHNSAIATVSGVGANPSGESTQVWNLRF
jgi:hypothetical protein